MTPIVNWPEVAIIGTGRSPRKNRSLWTTTSSPAKVLKLSCTVLNHRVIDGGTAQRQ
ncbi:2-oxo acid dehydrogenase subunit E2 [Limosilactobacillus fermentum]